MVSDERCGRALTYLQESDEDAAELKVEVERKLYLLDLARKKMFLASEGSVEQRKATAEVSASVGEAEQAYFTALLEHEKVKSQRITEALIVEVWRTTISARKQGMII